MIASLQTLIQITAGLQLLAAMLLGLFRSTPSLGDYRVREGPLGIVSMFVCARLQSTEELLSSYGQASAVHNVY